MNKTKSFFIAGLFIGALISAGAFSMFIRMEKQSALDNALAGGSSGSKIVLKLGHGLDSKHPVHLALEFMKSRLAELSGGLVDVDIYPGSVLGSETQCLEQLQNGSLAMTKTSSAAIENFIPEMAVFSLPYVFRSGEHYWNVLNGKVGKELLNKGE